MQFWKRPVAALAALIVAVALSSCASIDRSDSATPTATTPTMAAPNKTPGLGSCEIDFRKLTRGTVAAGEVVFVTEPSAVLYIQGDVEAEAKITTTGNGSCVFVTGRIHPNARIVTEGRTTTLIVQGRVDPSAHLHVDGASSMMWLPEVSAYDLGDISVNGPKGCELWLREGRITA